MTGHLLGSFLLLLLLLCTLISSRGLCWSFLFLLFLLFLLLVHGSRNKEVNDGLGQNIAVVVVLKLSEDIIQFVDSEFVPESCQNVDKIVFIKNVSLDDLSLDLLLNCIKM